MQGTDWMGSKEMIFGDKKSFAIELELLENNDQWVFGTFVFWLANHVAGDPADTSVDLNGCLNWLENFVHERRDRVEPALYEMDLKKAYSSLNVYADGQNDNPLIETYDDAYSRFHIEHIGMSSFDQLNMVLIENELREQRCIWQQNDQKIREVHLPENGMESVAIQVVDYYRREIRLLE